MKIVNSLLKLFLGDKTAKDIKKLQPLLDRVNTFDSILRELSLDELRKKTQEFRDKIKKATAKLRKEQEELKQKAES